MEQIKNNIKLLKGIVDELQDELLDVILVESNARILAYVNKKRESKLLALPDDLEYILQDVATVRFNRLNSEGTQQDSEEGTSFVWQNSYLSEHEDVLQSQWDEDNEGYPKQGKIYSY